MELETVCDNCGTVLDGVIYRNKIQITPCPSCLDDASDKGYDQGLAEGREEES